MMQVKLEEFLWIDQNFHRILGLRSTCWDKCRQLRP